MGAAERIALSRMIAAAAVLLVWWYSVRVSVTWTESDV